MKKMSLDLSNEEMTPDKLRTLVESLHLSVSRDGKSILAIVTLDDGKQILKIAASMEDLQKDVQSTPDVKEASYIELNTRQ